jgi:hypothetical protein
VGKVTSSIKESRSAKATEAVAKEIYDIENNYSKTRKANEYTKDAGAESRKRIAETDVLVDSVDKDGLIRTKQPGGAVEKYRKLTLDGTEGTVRENLVRSKETVNLVEVAKELTSQVYRSGLEGATLIKAIRGLKAELDGLKLRADDLGNIDLSKIHDAKISTTQNINYKKDSNPTIKYQKAKATAYKQIVEQKSKLEIDVEGKKYKIKDINKELGKYYEDLERLQMLDGARVKGGRLGKYTAQIAGNIAGGAVGGVVGGLPGMAVGSIVGGETSAILKGKAMSKTFGGVRGNEITKNPILEQARKQGKLPPATDLRVPDIKVGVPKGVPKTKEILKTERDIVKNVEQQKLAIKKGDFTLVSTLKEIYKVLVERLKDLVREARAEIKKNPEGGFVKNPFQSSKTRKTLSLEKSQLPSANDTTKGTKLSMKAIDEIPIEEQGTLTDFLDMVAGKKKFSAEDKIALEIETRKIVENSGGNPEMDNGRLATQISKAYDTNPLAQEVGKVDDYFHGGNLEGGIKPGLYLTKVKGDANTYAGRTTGNKVYKFSLPKDMKLVSPKEYDFEFEGFGYNREKTAKHFLDKGYDAMKTGDGDLIIFNPSKLKGELKGK